MRSFIGVMAALLICGDGSSLQTVLAGAYTAPATAGTYHVVATSSLTVPPSDGTTPWAPSPNDTTWANVASFGAVGDNVADDTAAFRAAAATKKKLFVPKPRVAYKLTSYVQVYNSVYGDGSMPLIKMYGASGYWDNSITYRGHGGHVMFLIDDYAGTGAVFQGLRLDGGFNGSQGGEHDHLIMIRGSNNVTVAHNELLNPVGDAVLVGGEAHPTYSQNVTIRNNVMKNPRRCNVALISARKVSITDNVLEKTNDFVTSIDIEPNPIGTEDVFGVEIARNRFYVPLQGAVMLYYAAGAKTPIGGDISVHDNTGTAVWSFYSNDPSQWTGVTTRNNF